MSGGSSSALRLSLLALISALLVVGCGNGEEERLTTGVGKEQKTAGTPSSEVEDGTSTPQGEQSGADNAGRKSSQGADGAGEQPEPSRGGEASIEDFGAEAAGAERQKILGGFEGYLSGLAAEDFPTACTYLASGVQRLLRRLAGGEGRAGGCASILPGLLAPTAPTAPAVARQQAEGEVTKVRVEGDRAFVIFRAPGAKLYQLPMVREAGEWRAALLAPSVLVPDL